MKTGTNRIAAVGWKLLPCIGILAGLAAGSAHAGGVEADPERPGATVGILDLECASRLRPHEIAPRHFVLDRVTDCALRRIDRPESLAGERSETTTVDSAAAAMAAASGSRDARKRRGDPQQSSVASAREARWSRTRDRLSNPQYASSLRVVGPGIRQRVR